MVPSGVQAPSSSLTLVVIDDADDGARSIMEAVDGAAMDGLARRFLRLVVGRDDGDRDAVRWAAEEVDARGPIPATRLFDRIAREGRLDLIQVVALCTAPHEPVLGRRMDDAMENLQRALDKLLGHGTEVIQARIAVSGYSEGIAASTFFSRAGARNLAVIPLDRMEDASTARPLERHDRESFRDHGAVELLTICGLWSSVGSSPLRDIEIAQPVDGEPQVRLVQSSVRFLRTPPIPARELVDPARELPIPEQFQPTTNPMRRVADLYQQVRVESLTYIVEDPPALATLDMGLGRLAAMVSSDILEVLRELPRIVLAAIRGQIAVLSHQAAQQALGSDSRIRLRMDDAVGRALDEARSADPEAFADRLDRLIRRSDLQMVDPIPGDAWTALSGRILGLADGDPGAEPFRTEALGDAAIVVTDRDVIVGGVPWQDLWSFHPEHELPAVEQLEELEAARTQAALDWVSDLFGLEGPEDEGDDAPGASRDSDGDETAALLDLDADVDSGVEVDAENEEASADSDRPVLVEDVEPSDVGEDPEVLRLTERPIPEIVDAPEDGLLLRALTDLRRQRRAATLDVRRLVAMVRQESDVEELRISPFVPGLALLGAGMILFVLGSSDLGNRFVMAGGWIRSARDVMFIVATILLATWAVAVSDLLNRFEGGIRTVLVVGIAGSAILGGLLFLGQIRAQISPETLRSNTIPGYAGLGLAALVAVALFQARRSGSEVRRRSGRLLAFATLAYAFVGLTLAQAQTGSLMRSLAPGVAARVDLLVAATGALLLVTAVSVLTFKRFSANRQLDVVEHRRAWAARQVAAALEARVRLQAAEWQWIGTAAVLARLVQHPFGVAAPEASGSISDVSDPAVLKGSRATLMLTNAGREAIDAKLRSILISPSWLRQQYELLVREFQIVLARRTGNAVSDLQDRRPEQDSYAPVMDTLVDDLLRGDRWEFARRVAAGQFDGVLARAADSLDLEEVYGPLLAEPGAMVLEGSDDASDTVRDFIHRILPIQAPEIPSGLTEVLFSADDDRRRMRAMIWWPDGLLGELASSVAQVSPTRFVRERGGGALVVTAMRLDVSQPFPHAQCFVSREGDGAHRSTGPALEAGLDVG